MLRLRKYNISHINLPSFADHKSFVKNHPYSKWYLILKEKPIGTFYIQKNNSIGINVVNPSTEIIQQVLYYIKSKFFLKTPKPSLVPPYFYINVASSNKDMQKIMESLDLVQIQTSYKFN